jgi:hypothetical protein
MARSWWRACRESSWKRGPYRNAIRYHLNCQIDPTAPADSMEEYLQWRIERKTNAIAWINRYCEKVRRERYVIESLEAVPQRITISKAREILGYDTMEEMREFLKTRMVEYGQI